MIKLKKTILIVAILLIIAFSFYIISPHDTVRTTTDFQGDYVPDFGSSDYAHPPSSSEPGESSQVGTTSYQDFFGTDSGGESSYGDFYESSSGGDSSYGDFFDSGSDSGSDYDSGYDSGSDSGSDFGGDSGGDGGDSGDGGDGGDGGDW